MAQRKKYSIHHCLKCLSEGKTKTQAKIKGDMKMVALDRPYINLFFHRSCYNKIVGNGSMINKWEKMNKFVQDTTDLWYNK